MVEYSKMKNADLEAILKDRGLPTGGKKADMVDRLTKDDEKKAEAAPTAPAKLHPEDEIDWDDEGEEGAGESAKSAPASSEKKDSKHAPTDEPETTANAGGKGQAPNPQAVPNQKADIDPSKTDDLAVKPPTDEKDGAEGTIEEKKEPTPDFTKGIAATNIDEELEKRRARAKRFGLKIDDDENLKKLERAKKFGESGPPKGLDEALPERRKRGRDDNEDSGANKRRGGGRFGGRRGRGGNRDGDRRRDHRDSRDSRDNRREDRGNANGGATWMSEEDRKRAEARKNKWAKPAAAS